MIKMYDLRLQTRYVRRGGSSRRVRGSGAPGAYPRGAAAILAMLFLVIFSSLAAAMAIVSQGNLRTADTQLKVHRSLAAAETGLGLMAHRLEQVTLGDPHDLSTYPGIRIREGVIDSNLAETLWPRVRAELYASFVDDFQYQSQSPTIEVTGALVLPAISFEPGSSAKFAVRVQPHPLPGEDYDSDKYQRPPFNSPIYGVVKAPVSSASPLDATFVRVSVTGIDGPSKDEIRRVVTMDFRLDKKIRYAILSRSRVMVGRNVMVEGPIGSRFSEVNLRHGHPVQMESDFRGLSSGLDALLDSLTGSLIALDADGDNRLSVYHPTERLALDNPDTPENEAEAWDLDGDGYLTGFDAFLHEFDADGNGGVTYTELEMRADSPAHAQQLLELIDTFGDADRAGFGDGSIDANDRYAKVRGEVLISADRSAWNEGAADADADDGQPGAYQDYFQGAIDPGYRESPLTFGDSAGAANERYEFEPTDFDTGSFRGRAMGDLATQAAAQAGGSDPNDPAAPHVGGTVREAVPYGSAYPYDWYDRPVYENMTFENVRIPKGNNALFRNCKFVGCTFVETETDNDDPNFNYAGMQESNGTQKHPDREAQINGGSVGDTKTISNNLRFDGCTFEGALVSDAPQQYTHVRNKIAFTGNTQFEIEDSARLTDEEKALYKRSTLLLPHYSVEMGTFNEPLSGESVNLSGTIVAGLIDMRGRVKVNGTILTTFEPKSNEGPVLGETSPQFNTTLGYFPSAAGDLEAELPPEGVGVIQVRYDPTLPLPDGILGPIELRPLTATYSEGAGL